MKQFLLFILFFWTVAGRSQTTPKEYKFTSMTDFGLFEEASMSGNVNVSLPLFDLQVPTYRYPVALEYNQEGNVNSDAEGGQFGEAWNLNLMGAVTRITRPITPTYTDATYKIYYVDELTKPFPQECGETPVRIWEYPEIVFDERYYANGIPLNGSRPDHERDVFKFQVPGVSGKFYLDYSLREGLKVRLLEQSDYCSFKIIKASGSATIDAIEITDKKGYRYVLDIKSNINKNYMHRIIVGRAAGAISGGDCNQYLRHVNVNMGNLNPEANNRLNQNEKENIYGSVNFGTQFWQELNLSKIYDKDGRLLINIEYDISNKRWTDARLTFDMFGGLRSMEKYIVKSIELANVGKATFKNSLTVHAGKHLTEEITLTDIKGNVLKTIDFTYESAGAYLNGKMVNKALLTSVKDYSNTSKPQVTTMDYKKYLMGGDNIYDADHYFGYAVKGRYNSRYSGKENFAADMFALQKIKYPTGGVVLYRFGPNTAASEIATARLYNMDNQIFNEITAQSTSTAGTYRFTLGTVDRVFILTQLTNGVKLYRVVNGARQLVTTIYRKEKSDPISPIYRYVNKTDNVYEWPYSGQLAAGTYEVESNDLYNPGFTVMQVRYVADASLKNFIYTEGLRIEEVAYFNQDVQQSLLESTGINTKPEKHIRYDYGHSARQLFMKSPSQKPLFEPAVYYRNVTTINEGIGKKTTVYASDDAGLVYKKPAKAMVYDQAGNLLEETVFNRETEGAHAAIQDLRMMLTPFEKKTTQTTKSYDDNKSFTTTTVTDHNATYYEPGAVTATDPLGKVSRAEYDYAFKGTAIVNTAGRSYINGTLNNQQLHTYDTAGNLIKTEFKTPEMTAYEKIGLENTKYIDGLLVGYTQADGTPVTLAYGYNGTQVIAKLVNLDATTFYSATYEPLLTNLDNYSNPYNSNYNETSLKTALNGMRATFPNALITSYTYKPMVGISSITDENLKTTTYEYDTYNRLSTIKDYLGNILKEYQYNLAN